jgi:glycosyltransferase involved in cell wall biosynthesis
VSLLVRPRSREVEFTNDEGDDRFAFSLPLRAERRGVSARLRVKDEAHVIWCCLASIYDVFDEIVLVDNGSTDATATVVEEFKRAFDPQETIKVHSYPPTIVPHGPQELTTSPGSIHSLAYYNNWCLSRCRFSYSCKWDADMVLRRDRRDDFREFLRAVRAGRARCYSFSGQTVYRDLNGDSYLARGEVFREPRIVPVSYRSRFVKKGYLAPPRRSLLTLRRPRAFPGVAFYELKFADRDEFSHWATTDFPRPRKRREWESFHLIRSGRVEDERFVPLPADFLASEIPFDRRSPRCS